MAAPRVPPRRLLLAGGGRALSIAEVVGNLVPIALLPFMTRTLGIEAYGRLQFVMALGAFAGLLADPGLGRVATRHAARRPEHVARVFARVQPLRLATGLLAGALLVAGGLAVGARGTLLGLLAWQAALLAVQALAVDPYLVAIGASGWVGYARAASLVAYALGVVATVAGPDDVARVLAVSVAVAAAGALASRWRLARVTGRLRWRPRWRSTSAVVREAGGFAAASAMSSVYSRIDVLMLRAFRGEAAVGLYSACVRLTEAVFGILPVILGTLYPLALREDARAGRLSGHGQRAIRLAAMFGVPAAAGAAVAGGPILEWISGPSYAGADLSMGLLGAAALAGLIASVISTFGLGARGRSRELLRATAAGAAVNAGLNVAAIPALGGAGAALTTALAQATVAVVAARRSREFFRVDPWRALRGWIAPSAAMAAVVGLARLFGAPAPVLLTVGLASYALAFAAFGSLRRRERRGLRNLVLGARGS